jgi:hypothetical protein
LPNSQLRINKRGNHNEDHHEASSGVGGLFLKVAIGVLRGLGGLLLSGVADGR